MTHKRNPGSRLLVTLFILGFYCACFAPFVVAESNVLIPSILEQEPSSGSTSVSSSPLIRVKFDDPSNQIQKEKILLEIDRNDVSSLLQFNDHILSYQPVEPLQPGIHEVRISGQASDGRIIKEINWSFTVAQPQTPRSWQFGIEPSAGFEYKLRKESTLPDRHRFNSNINFSSQTTGSFQTNFTSVLQAQDPLPGAVPNEFDLVNYRADITTASSLISVGDVVVNYDALAVANLARRGIFYQQRLPFLRSGFEFASVRSEQIIGFRNGLGISDSQQRVDTFSFFFSPLTNQESLGLRIFYLRGENAKEQGFNFGGVTQGSKGDAFGFNLNSSLLTNQLRIETSVAGSDFDFNASDGFAGNRDKALQARIIYDPAPWTLKNRPSKLFAQLELQDLGLFFKSLGNPFLVADRRGLNLNSTWSLGTIALTGSIANFHDNVKGSNLLPSVDSRSYAAAFSFNPIGTTGPPKWPSLNISATRSEQESTGEAVSFLAVHSIVDSIGTTVALNRLKWSLNLITTLGVNHDLTNRVPDTDVINIGLGGFIQPAQFWNVGTSINFTRQGDRVTKVDNDLWTMSLTAGIPIQPERLTLDSQLSLFTSDSSDQLNKSSNFSGTAQLSYHFHSLFKSLGRQTLALRASYNRSIIEAPFIVRQKGFEIFALVDVSWPFRGGHGP